MDICIIDKQVNEHNVTLRLIHSGDCKCLANTEPLLISWVIFSLLFSHLFIIIIYSNNFDNR